MAGLMTTNSPDVHLSDRAYRRIKFPDEQRIFIFLYTS